MPETYVKMPESDYVDICDTVRFLAGTEEPLTSVDVVDTLGVADGLWNHVEDRGKVVPNGPLVGLITQTNRTVTENGTYDTTTNNNVVVNVPTSGGGGAQVYTISGTGAAHVSVTDDVGLLYDEDRTNHVVLLMSAVFITLGTQAASAMYFSQDGHANQITFKGTSGLGDTTAVFGYTASGSSITEIWPVSLTIGSTDYTPYLARVAWYITVMDNRGA